MPGARIDPELRFPESLSRAGPQGILSAAFQRPLRQRNPRARSFGIGEAF